MTEEKTLGDLAITAYCAVLDEGTDSMNVASDLEDHEIRGLRAAASAVREKVIEECALLAEQHTGWWEPMTCEAIAGSIRALAHGRELETNLIHPHPRQDGQQCDHPGAGEAK